MSWFTKLLDFFSEDSPLLDSTLQSDEDYYPSPVEFEAFPKIQRLYDSSKGVVITEKLDGSNSAIHIRDGRVVGIQSRKRLITPDNDNFGFARWVYDNEDLIPEILGDGLHFGEWIGKGIQRGYGLQRKEFRLFNAPRWIETLPDPMLPELGTVPLMYQGSINDVGLDSHVEGVLSALLRGSRVNGFDRPEGVVVFFPDSAQSFKVIPEGWEPGSKKKTRG